MNLKKNKNKGFTLVEVLVVVTIIGMASIALTMTARSMVIANLRLTYINNIHAKTQEFSQYFVKVARMSSSRDTADLLAADPVGNINWNGLGPADQNKLESGQIDSDELVIIWREPDPAVDLSYRLTALKFDESTISNHFKNMEIDKLKFRGGGFSDVNKVTMYFEVLAGPNPTGAIDPNDPLSVNIPVQMTVSFRDF